jgi:phospholipase/carboxylesterase
LITLLLALSLTQATPPPTSLKDSPLRYSVVEAPGTAEDAPLVLALHGLGDDRRGFSRFVRNLGLPVRFIVPDAPDTRPGGGYSWYRPRSASAPADVRRSLKLLAKLIRDLAKRYPGAGKPLVTGFSQGGVMSFALAATHPNLIRGAAPIAGYLIPAEMLVARPDKALPMLIMHGKTDKVVPFHKSKAAEGRFRAAGYRVSFFEHPGGHRIPREALAQLRYWLATQLSR